MAKQVHIHIHRSKARDAGEGEGKGRWITLSPSGTHVKVDGNGEITAGPKGMTGKKPSELSKGKIEAPKPPAVSMSSLKEGQALYDKSGQKVDEVENIQKRSLGKGLTINTRAGYQVHVDENGTNSQGWSNEKPAPHVSGATGEKSPNAKAEGAPAVKAPAGFKVGSRGVQEARASNRETHLANRQAAQRALESSGFVLNKGKSGSSTYGSGLLAEEQQNFVYEHPNGTKARVLHSSTGKGGWTQIHYD